MAKRKNLQNNIDEFEKGYIQAKLDGKHIIAESNEAPYQFKQMPYNINIKCKNQKQKEFINALKDKNNEICFGVGSAGTGKSFLTLSVALQLLKDETTPFNSIVIFIPCIESVSALKIGYLKGDFEQKTEVYKQNAINLLTNILEKSNNTNAKSIVNYMVSQGIIKFELINFIKGKTYENCILCFEESEDYSKDDMLLMLTRKGGETCKLFISGDDKQCSRTDIKGKNNITGLRFASNVLSDMDKVSVTEFTVEDIVRDPLLTEIIKRFEENS